MIVSFSAKSYRVAKFRECKENSLVLRDAWIIDPFPFVPGSSASRLDALSVSGHLGIHDRGRGASSTHQTCDSSFRERLLGANRKALALPNGGRLTAATKTPAQTHLDFIIAPAHSSPATNGSHFSPARKALACIRTGNAIHLTRSRMAASWE